MLLGVDALVYDTVLAALQCFLYRRIKSLARFIYNMRLIKQAGVKV